MSTWEEKFGKKEIPEKAKPQGVPIGGTFGCHHCNGYAFEGTYFPTDGVLKFTCDDGHTSFIEGLKI